jgi:threonine/homoserine/homoserine lactone efflux protein
MDLSALVVFGLALAVAAGSPGPNLAALVGRVIAHGWREVLPFAAAMWVGEALWLTLAVFGLAALAEAFHWAFVVVKYCGVAYLLWLAWRMWRAPVAVNADGRGPAGGAVAIFFAGIAVTLGNPKIMLFYLALLPALVDLEAVSPIGWLELTATMLVVLASVDLGYIWLAARARRLFRSPRAMRLANRACAGIMGAAAGAIASR